MLKAREMVSPGLFLFGCGIERTFTDYMKF